MDRSLRFDKARKKAFTRQLDVLVYNLNGKLRYVEEYGRLPFLKRKVKREVAPRYRRLIKAAETLLNEIDETYLG